MNMKDIKMNNIKVLKVMAETPTKVYFKHSYEDEFSEITLYKRVTNRDINFM